MIRLPAKTLIATAAGVIAGLVSANVATAAPAMPTATGFTQDTLFVDVEHRVNSNRKFNKHRHANRVHRRNHRRNHSRHRRNRIQNHDVYTPWFGIIIGSDKGYRNDCRRSYRNWQRTGSYYWRSRYYDCRNG